MKIKTSIDTKSKSRKSDNTNKSESSSKAAEKATKPSSTTNDKRDSSDAAKQAEDDVKPAQTTAQPPAASAVASPASGVTDDDGDAQPVATRDIDVSALLKQLPTKRATVLFAYEARGDTELTVPLGAVVEVINNDHPVYFTFHFCFFSKNIIVSL